MNTKDLIKFVSTRSRIPCKSFWGRLWGRGCWMWPTLHFWTFTPWGWLLALMWNAFEVCGAGCPGAGWAFGVITGMKAQRVDDGPH
jgi:hypothetical protein